VPLQIKERHLHVLKKEVKKRAKRAKRDEKQKRDEKE
jgi:hypothetical protein